MYIVDPPTVATWAFAKAESYGIDLLSLSDLHDFGWAIQEACNNQDLDVLVNRQPQDFRDMTARWYDDHSHQYFLLITKDEKHYVRRVANLLILKDRFTPVKDVFKAILAIPFSPTDFPLEIGCGGCLHSTQHYEPDPNNIVCKGCRRYAPDHYTPKEVK